MDNHALHTPQSAGKSIKKLATYLSATATSETEKARAIYRWITHNIVYDIKGLSSKQYAIQSPEEILQSRCTVCEGYATLFQSLGKAMGLEAVKIGGYAKGYDYCIGNAFDEPRHCWNTVKINGRWRLCDTTWGAGCIDDQKRFIRQFNEHYFLTPPEQFIYDHLPEEPRWQLLDRPVTSNQFRKLAFLKPAFFLHGLKLQSHLYSEIKAQKQVGITLIIPDDVMIVARLERDKRELYGALTFGQKKGGIYKVKAVFPRPAEYLLKLYVKNRDAAGEYEWALDYKILVNQAMPRTRGFPVIYDAFNTTGSYLYSPVRGYLDAGSKHKFRIRTPGAQRVAVITVAGWFHLQQRSDDQFEGIVTIVKGVIEIGAQFRGAKQYMSLLQYRGI